MFKKYKENQNFALIVDGIAFLLLIAIVPFVLIVIKTLME